MDEKTLYIFQPDAMKEEVLEKLFIGEKKDALLERIANEIKNAAKKRSPRHYLIIGPRGIGKTHFVTLLYYKLLKDAENIMLVKLSEEEFSISRVSDLFLRIFETTKLKSVAPSLRKMSDEDLIATSIEKLKETKKRIVIFLENLNQIMEEQMEPKEVKKLRSLLQMEDLFIVVATAPLIFPEVGNHGKPFFDFFEIIYLSELSREEAKELISKIAQIEGNDHFLKKLSKNESKIDAITSLTGGSPRIIIMLYTLTKEEKILDVEKAFFKILDKYTPYYQDIFRALSGNQRKIFDGLISLSGPETPKEIAEKTRIPQNTVNTQMRRLEKAGYVRSYKQGRSTKYEVRERLFRLWREHRKEPFGSRRIPVVLEFLKIWYSTIEREDMFLKCIELCKEPTTAPEATKEAKYWYQSLPYKTKEDLLHKLVRENVEIDFHVLDSLIDDTNLKKLAIREEVKLLLENEDYEKSLRILDDAIIKRNFTEFLPQKIVTLYFLERLDEALTLAEKSIKEDPDNQYIHRLYADLLLHLDRYEEALGAANKAIELDPSYQQAWNLKGQALMNLDRYEEALGAANKAIELDPSYQQAWNLKGQALMNLDRYEEALGATNKAIELDPSYQQAWNLKGDVLGCLEMYEEALGATNKAIELDPSDEKAWRIKGQALLYLDRYEEALEPLNEALKLDPLYQLVWKLKGDVLRKIGKYREALEATNKSLELNPLYKSAWKSKSYILLNQGMHEEALGAANKAIELDPSYQQAWNLKGQALINLDRYEEALEATNKTIELNPENDRYWRLKSIILAQLGKTEEALNNILKAIDLNPKNSLNWAERSDLLQSLGKQDEAKEAAQQALAIAKEVIKLVPNHFDSWRTIAIVSMLLDDLDEALVSFKKMADLAATHYLKNVCENATNYVSWLICSRESIQAFRQRNFGHALETLKDGLNYLSKLSEEDEPYSNLEQYLKEIVNVGKKDIFQTALESILEIVPESQDFLKPFIVALDIIKTEDTRKFYDVQIEIREVVAEVVRTITGSNNLLPEKYKTTTKS